MKAKMKLSYACYLAGKIVCDSVLKYELCGSIRRRCELVGDIDVLILRSEVYAWKYRMECKDIPIVRGGDCDFDCMYENCVINFRSVPKESWGAGVLFLTGGADFNLMCRSAAKEKGMKLNRYGLTDNTDIVVANEKQILIILDLEEYIDPVMR